MSRNYSWYVIHEISYQHSKTTEFSGWYRDCGIIPHTSDLDLCIMADEHVEDFHNSFIGHPKHPLMRIIGKSEYGFELTFWLKHNIKGYKTSLVDFFYMYKQNETHNWTPLLINFKQGTRVKEYVAKIEKLCLADIYGHLYFVPCNVSAYMNTRFGHQWNVSNSRAGYFEDGVWYQNDGNWNMKEDEFVKWF